MIEEFESTRFSAELNPVKSIFLAGYQVISRKNGRFSFFFYFFLLCCTGGQIGFFDELKYT